MDSILGTGTTRQLRTRPDITAIILLAIKESSSTPPREERPALRLTYLENEEAQRLLERMDQRNSFRAFIERRYGAGADPHAPHGTHGRNYTHRF